MNGNEFEISSQVSGQYDGLSSRIDKEISSVPIFKQVSKNIYNTDIITSKFDGDSGNDDSTRHFLIRPRPTTSIGIEPRSVRYKYKTLSGSSAILRSRRQRSHESLEEQNLRRQRGGLKDVFLLYRR